MGDVEKAVVAAVKLYQELNRPSHSTIKNITKMRDDLDTVEAAHDPEDGENIAAEAIEEQDDSSQAGQEAQALINAAAETVAQDLDDITDFASLLAPDKGYDLESQGSRIIELGLDETLMRTLRGQDDFRKIMEAVGRLKLMAGEIKSRLPKPSPTPLGITQGSTLSSVLPQEFALLSDPRTKLLFYTRYLANDLLMYDKRQRQREGKGPIVCLLDVSNSMRGVNERNAKAFFLQMVRTAHEQKRKVAYIPFATKAGDPLFISDYNDLIQVITPHRYTNLGGGTDFDAALAAGTTVVRDEETYKNADIIMLSDGESRVTDQVSKLILEAKDKLGCRIMGVLFSGKWQPDMKALLDVGVECSARGNLSWAEDLLEKVA